MNLNFTGIDFGAKLAGTTAITYVDSENKLATIQSAKGQDSDIFLLDQINKIKPKRIFIDAPLSLPSGYFHQSGEYFYRAADKQLQAMSPMFLGGLTARAIALTSKLNDKNIICLEVYPGALVRYFSDLHSVYNKKESNALPVFISKLKYHFPPFELPVLTTWHQVDSILAWWTGYRYNSGKALSSGNPEEGLIWV